MCFQYYPTNKMLNVRVQVNQSYLSKNDLISDNFDSHAAKYFMMWLQNIKP